MNNLEINDSISSNNRLQKFIDEAHNELNKIQPEIDYLEQCQKKLTILKEQQLRLNSLILSLNGLLNQEGVNKFEQNTVSVSKELYANINAVNNATIDAKNNKMRREIFLPDQAINQVKSFLRIKNNLNYEIFKAVVFNSGTAKTEEIKNYLVENNIKQPKTGKGFNDVELKEISSRVHYLVRKNILISIEPGNFRSIFGWQQI